MSSLFKTKMKELEQIDPDIAKFVSNYLLVNPNRVKEVQKHLGSQGIYNRLRMNEYDRLYLSAMTTATRTLLEPHMKCGDGKDYFVYEELTESKKASKKADQKKKQQDRQAKTTTTTTAAAAAPAAAAAGGIGISMDDHIGGGSFPLSPNHNHVGGGGSFPPLPNGTNDHGDGSFPLLPNINHVGGGGGDTFPPLRDDNNKDHIGGVGGGTSPVAVVTPPNDLEAHFQSMQSMIEDDKNTNQLYDDLLL